MTDPRVRPATEDDVPSIVGLIHELAEYEHEADQCHATDELMMAALFGAEGTVSAHVAEVDGKVVGIAVWFLNFSTWDAVPGIYLEDLYVTGQHRRAGLGVALFEALAQVCVERGYSRLVWQVLDWNTPSIAFYESLGAVRQGEWLTYRLSKRPLRDLAHAE